MGFSGAVSVDANVDERGFWVPHKSLEGDPHRGRRAPFELQRRISSARLETLLERAFQSGAFWRNSALAEWSACGRCNAPNEIYLVGSDKPFKLATGGPHGAFVPAWRAPPVQQLLVKTRCKHCADCIATRRRQWIGRAMTETSSNGARSWFTTLTASPEHHARMAADVDAQMEFEFPRAVEAARRRRAPDPSYEDVRWPLLAARFNKEITDWLKRVRGRARHAFRYLCVLERHKNGLPHAHILVHENADFPITRRRLCDAWRIGFSQAKLFGGDNADKRKVASYVAKYISKTMASRIRSSIGYGKGFQGETLVTEGTRCAVSGDRRSLREWLAQRYLRVRGERDGTASNDASREAPGLRCDGVPWAPETG